MVAWELKSYEMEIYGKEKKENKNQWFGNNRRSIGHFWQYTLQKAH